MAALSEIRRVRMFGGWVSEQDNSVLAVRFMPLDERGLPIGPSREITVSSLTFSTDSSFDAVWNQDQTIRDWWPPFSVWQKIMQERRAASSRRRS